MANFNERPFFSLEAISRGYENGKRDVKEFLRTMEAGGLIQEFESEVNRLGLGNWGFSSPIGEFLGWARHPKDMFLGLYYAARNEIKKKSY